MFISISRKRIRWQWQGWRALFTMFRKPTPPPLTDEERRAWADELYAELSPETQEAFAILSHVVRESGFTVQQCIDGMRKLRR